MNPELAAAMAAAVAATSDPANSVAFAAEFAALAAGKPAQPHPMPFDVMTAPQVAAYLQLPEATVLEEANAGRLPGRRIAGEWRFIHIALTEWMRSGGAVPAASTRPRVGVVSNGTDEDPEKEIAEIYAARRALGTVGDHFPDESDE